MASRPTTSRQMVPAVRITSDLPIWVSVPGFLSNATANIALLRDGLVARVAMRLDLVLCPTSGLNTTFWCIDTKQNVELCGRCVGAGGVDCISIPKASGVE